MPSSFSLPLGSLILASSLCFLGCGGSLPEPFPLHWQGVDTMPAPSDRVRAAISRKTFRIEPTVDRRGDPSKVGFDEDSHYAYRTTTNVAAFCSDRIKDMVATAGFKLVEQGDYVLQSEIAELNVAEGGLFNGDVRITFRVFTPGKPAFESVYEGKSKRWGRSHSTENINEAISNALASATEKFLRDELLADALEGKGGAEPIAAASAATAPTAAPAPAPAPAQASPKPAASGKGPYNL